MTKKEVESEFKMHMTSNIEDDSFYDEANDMQDNWGDSLRKIDILKDKVDNNEPISFNDSLYILWAEYKISLADHQDQLTAWACEHFVIDLKFTIKVWQAMLLAVIQKDIKCQGDRCDSKVQ